MSASGNAPFFIDNEVIVLARNGTWLADGMEITHEPTRRLFARSLHRDDQGYLLQVGRETKRIQVEDTAYFVEALEGGPAEGFVLRLSDDAREKLNPQALAYRPGRLTCRINRHGKPEDARFLHAAYFELLKHLEEDPHSYYLTLEGKRVVLAPKGEPQPASGGQA